MFSILTRGEGKLRAVSNSYKEEEDALAVHNALVPRTLNPFIDYAAEQLIQCVIASSLKKEVLYFETDSRYVYPLPFPVIFESSVSGIPDNIIISYQKIKAYNVNLEQTNKITIDSSAKSIHFLTGDRKGDMEYYTEEGGLSSIIRFNDRVSFRIKDLAPGVYNTTISYKLPFNRTLLDIKNELPASTSSRYKHVEHKQLPDYLASIVMDICYKQELK